MATGHAKVKAHTREKPGGGTTTVHQHGRRVQRGSSTGERFATAGKAAGVSAGMAGIGVMHAAFQVTWASAVIVTVVATGIIWAGGQLLTTGHSKRRRSRPRKRKSSALKYGRRAKLAHYRYRQWRHRRGKGTWSQRARYGTGARKRKAGKR